MAGSDWPVSLVATGYEQWWSALQQWCVPLDYSARAQIFSRTVCEFYSLAASDQANLTNVKGRATGGNTFAQTVAAFRLKKDLVRERPAEPGLLFPLLPGPDG